MVQRMDKKDLETKKQITNYLKSLRFKSMGEAKNVLAILLDCTPSYKTDIHQLQRILCEPANPEFSGWGWTSLRYDLLSNKYGAAHRQGRDGKTYFVLQLPPVEKIYALRMESDNSN